MSALTRRRFLGVTAAAGAAVVFAGTGGSSAQEADATPSPAGSGAWSFTDDRGTTVSLQAQPERIVAYDLAASALMNFGVKLVGLFGSFPVDKTPNLTGLDLSGVTILGEAYGAINLEALTALRPDLIVTIFDPRLTGPVIGLPDAATQALAEHIAPTVAINSIKELPDVIDRFEELGASLGADPNAPGVTEAHQRFQSASARLQAATAAKPGLTALALSAGSTWGFAFARPDAFPNLRLFQQLGLKMVTPASPPGDINKKYNSFFYEYVSFELADVYPADLILYSILPAALDLQTLSEIPTWQRLPAVQAGQLVPWRQLDPFSYKLLADDLDALAAAVEGAEIITSGA
jgi:iron complex transport system substrate-binding protein